MSWKVFYPEQVIATARSRVDSIIVITKGAVRMQFPESDGGGGTKAHTVVASVGELWGLVGCGAACGVPSPQQLT
jgi:hypothetical protein